MVRRIYISPHFDDAVLSCGGVIYQQTSQGDEVVVITVCAGDSKEFPRSTFAVELEERWETGPLAVDIRREEDKRACAILGAGIIHLPVPDAIYRTSSEGDPYYASEESIIGKLHPSETELVDELALMLERACSQFSIIYAPIGYGGHVDHRLTRKAVDQLGKGIWYYQDFPYAIRGGIIPKELDLPDGEKILTHLNKVEISLWSEAVKEYRSQLSTFWSHPDMARDELEAAHDLFGGIPFIHTN
jgi:LmbE family N-acetylglucosaminyl deacetylase